jgi:hypothetical protein
LSFKKGDIVRLKEEHKRIAPRLFGRDLEIDKIDRDLYYVKEVGALRGKPGDAVFDYRLEYASTRIEGKPIDHKDIKVGDTILNTFDIGDVKLTRQGVVRQIGNRTGGGTQLWTAGGRRVDVDTYTDTYTLVKAAPEVDKVLERVKKATTDDLVEFPVFFGNKILARRLPTLRERDWAVLYSDGWVYKSNEEFADLIRDIFDKVRWIGQ